MKYRLLLILFLFVGYVGAQQNNLWSTEFGSRSALVAGAVTASVRDNSAIYYNPGALGFTKNSNIGLAANMANIYTTYIQNGAGEGHNMYFPFLDFVPQFISGVIKSKKIPAVTFTYAAFNKQKAKLNFHEVSSLKIDLYPQFAGQEDFNSTYKYNSEIVETWVGLGAGYLLDDNWSVGLSLFFSYRSEITNEYVDNVVFSNNDIVANTIFSSEFNLGQLSMIPKFGIAYEDDYLSWGATITASNISTGLFTGALMNRKESVREPGEDNHYYNVYSNWADARYRHPWEFDTGIQFSLGKGVFNSRVTYFLGQDPYVISEFDDESEVSTNSNGPLFANKNKVMYATKSIVNFAVGFERPVSKNIVLLTGFKTDFNVFDDDKLDVDDYWVTSVSYWNVYTATLGVDYKTERDNNIVIGVSYRFSNSKGDRQIVNITDPDTSNYLIGVKNNDTKTNINGYSLVVGYTYNFSKPVKKDIRDKINIETINPF